MDRAAFEAAARACGCTATPTAQPGVMFVECPSDEAKIAWLDSLATLDARYDPRVRELAKAILQPLPKLTAREAAAAIHAAVRDRVRFLGEGVEFFQAPIDTWTSAMGDCDCVARLIAALCRSVGLQVSIAGGILRRPNGQPRHVAPRIFDGQALQWAEATMQAGFGEHPIAAFNRLNPGERSDLEGLATTRLEVKGKTPASVHVNGRAALNAAWDSLVADGEKMPDKTAGALQAAQGIVLVEGGYGNGFGRCPEVKNNWGSVQFPISKGGCGVGRTTCAKAAGLAGPQTITCPPGSGWCTDTHVDAAGKITSYYEVCFASFDTAAAGAKHFLRTLLVQKGRESLAAVIGSGDADAIGMAVHATRYSEMDGHIYGRGIAARAKEVAAALGEPVLVVEGAPVPSPTTPAASSSAGWWAAGLALVVVGAAGAVSYKWGRDPVPLWKAKAAA